MQIYVDPFGKHLELPEFDGTPASLCRELRKAKLFPCAFHVENDAPDGSTFRVVRRRWHWDCGYRRNIAIVYVKQ